MMWELIHCLVEMLNRTFENVSELDIMINSGLVRSCLFTSVCAFHGFDSRLHRDRPLMLCMSRQVDHLLMCTRSKSLVLAGTLDS